MRCCSDGTAAAQIPNAPSTWTQAPRSWAIGDDLRERVVGAGVHVAGLGAHDRRAVDPGEHLAQGLRCHPALFVGGDLADSVALTAETEHLERGVHGDVAAFVGHDGDGWRPLETVPLDVPAGPLEDAMAGGGQCREVRHRRAGHESDARPGRQVQQLHEPGGGHLFRDSRGGRSA